MANISIEDAFEQVKIEQRTLQRRLKFKQGCLKEEETNLMKARSKQDSAANDILTLNHLHQQGKKEEAELEQRAKVLNLSLGDLSNAYVVLLTSRSRSTDKRLEKLSQLHPSASWSSEVDAIDVKVQQAVQAASQSGRLTSGLVRMQEAIAKVVRSRDEMSRLKHRMNQMKAAYERARVRAAAIQAQLDSSQKRRASEGKLLACSRRSVRTAEAGIERNRTETMNAKKDARAFELQRARMLDQLQRLTGRHAEPAPVTAAYEAVLQRRLAGGKDN